MRWFGLISAILAVGTAGPAAAQIYPYLATVPVGALVAPAPSAFLNGPQGLAFDAVANHLVIAEAPEQVVQIVDGTSFALLATLGVDGTAGADAGHFAGPSGVAIDSTRNRILVADTGNNRVQVFDAATLALVGTLGVSGIAGADDAHLSSPAGVALDGSDARIVVADAGNDRVQLFDANSLAVVATIGVAGTPGSDNAHLSGPQAVAIDGAAGHLLVADTGNNRIQVFDAASGVYLATIAQLGGVANLGIDVAGRRLFAAEQSGFDVVVIDTDSLAPVSLLGLIGSFGVDNARFLVPSGMAFDPATGRIFAADAFLDRIQIFGQPSALVAAVAPAGRSVSVAETASIFATIINAGGVALENCRISLPNDAPPALALAFQATNPATNVPVGQLDQPVAIAAGGSQSFVLTLAAATPITALEQSFLFACDGTTPAPIFAGINTADLTFSAAPTADIIVAAATPGGSGVVQVPETASPFTAFPIAAFNIGASAQLLVSADSGSFLPVPVDGQAPGFKQTLPLTVLICQTNPLTGQCLAAPAPQLMVDFGSGGTATFTIFVAGTGAPVPDSIEEPRLYVRFDQPTGAAVPDSVGNASVAVATATTR